MSDIYTVQLTNPTTGAIVLDQVSASSASNAVTAAVGNAPVSGIDVTDSSSTASDFTAAGEIVDQQLVLTVSGTDVSGNPIVSPTAIPPIQAVTPSDASGQGQS